MNMMATLTAARDQAFAAWRAAPERSKAEKVEKARLADALTAASKALNAAKRATEAQPEASADERLSAFVAENGNRAVNPRAQALRDELRHAATIRRAYAWPRCGDGFPSSASERAANTWAVANHGSIDAAMAALEIFS